MFGALHLNQVLLGLQADTERLLEALDLLRGRGLDLPGLLVDLLTRLLLLAAACAAGGDHAAGGAVGGTATGVIVGDLADQGTGGGTDQRALGAGPLAFLLDRGLLRHPRHWKLLMLKARRLADRDPSEAARFIERATEHLRSPWRRDRAQARAQHKVTEDAVHLPHHLATAEGQPGIRTASEPAAMMHCSNATTDVPASPSTAI